MNQWTFDSLAHANSTTLEELMLTRPAPDYDQIHGFRYAGWNHGFGASLLSGEKLSKAFLRKGKRTMGFNEVILQDHQRHKGKWDRLMIHDRPVQLAFYRVSDVKSEKKEKLYEPYPNAGVFDYALPKMNSGINAIFQCIRDVVVLPNPGDHSLMLCKAHFRRTATKSDFYCYFQLGHRLPIDFPPW